MTKTLRTAVVGAFGSLGSSDTGSARISEGGRVAADVLAAMGAGIASFDAPAGAQRFDFILDNTAGAGPLTVFIASGTLADFEAVHGGAIADDAAWQALLAAHAPIVLVIPKGGIGEVEPAVAGGDTVKFYSAAALGGAVPYCTWNNPVAT
jgi:hypothetical protein